MKMQNQSFLQARSSALETQGEALIAFQLAVPEDTIKSKSSKAKKPAKKKKGKAK